VLKFSVFFRCFNTVFPWRWYSKTETCSSWICK